MYNPKYCLFYDNHTMKAVPDVGANFDVELFTDRIKDCGVDYLAFHARCNQGMAYYDTQIGIKHPSLQFDLFGRLAEACNRKGIALAAYFNAGISSEEGKLHRDWTTLYFDGRSLREPRFTPHVRTMCYNSPYRDHLIEMVKEVVTNYQIGGLMIDCLINYPCVCPVCVSQMKAQGIDWADLDAVSKFSETSALRLAKDIAEAARAINPQLLISNNYPPYEDLTGISNYFDVVCLPASDGGYEFMPVMAHYVRTLGDMSVLNMTGRFYEWGDFGGLLPEEAIKSELLYGLANGMRPNIGGHFHPRGDIETPVLDRIEKIYKELQSGEEWYNGAKPVTEVAIVYPKPVQNIKGDRELRSAVRMLSELKLQFDVVTHASDWGKYKLLILPDSVLVDEESAKRIKTHIDAGRAVIASGESGLDLQKNKFVLPEDWGLAYHGMNDLDPAYFEAGEAFGRDLPAMPLSLYSQGITLKAAPGTEVHAKLVKPYQNRAWDGEYAIFYNPPDKVTDMPALTIHDQVAHFSHKIFTGYFEKASVEIRNWFRNVSEYFLPQPLVKAASLPSYARVFVTEQAGRTMVHLLSYIPEMRGNTPMIEEPITLHHARLGLRIGAKKIKQVYTAPQKQELDFIDEDGYVNVTIPESKGYSLIVFEWE